MRFPAQLPGSPSTGEGFNEERRRFLEIEMKMAKTVIVEDEGISSSWAKDVFSRLPNLSTVKVANVDLNVRAADLLCLCLCHYTDVGWLWWSENTSRNGLVSWRNIKAKSQFKCFLL